MDGDAIDKPFRTGAVSRILIGYTCDMEVARETVDSRRRTRRRDIADLLRPPYPSLLIVFVFLVLSAINAPRPLHLDNVEFPAVALRTATSGLPVYYHGELEAETSALYHPPLYIYLLAAWIRAFGSSVVAMRMFGVACVLLQGLITLEIVRTLYATPIMQRISAPFWLLFLLNPYTIQTAGICDIDSTIYGPFLCLTILAALRVSWSDGQWRSGKPAIWEYTLIAAGLFFCFWAKLTTVLLLIPFLWLILVTRLGRIRAAVVSMAVVLGGMGAFAGSYWIYGKALGLDVGYTYDFVWASLRERGSSGNPGLSAFLRDHYDNFAFMVRFMFSWIGALPWLAAMAFLSIAAFDAIGRKDKKSLHAGLVLGLAMLSTIYYCAQVKTFGFAPFKYVFVYWGLVLAAPLLLLERLRRRSTSPPDPAKGRSMYWLYGTIYAATFAFGILAARDTLMLRGFHGPYRWVALAPAIGLGVALSFVRLRRTAFVTAASALAMYGGLQCGIGVFQTQADYSTTYDYGQTGFADTVAFLRTNTTPDDILAAMKDIGFACQRRYYPTYLPIYGSDLARIPLMRAIETGKIAYAVFTEDRGQDQLIVNPAFRSWILANCRLVRSIGNYRIYKPTAVAADTTRNTVDTGGRQVRSDIVF